LFALASEGIHPSKELGAPGFLAQNDPERRFGVQKDNCGHEQAHNTKETQQ
jgi:hypothetical protein